jgi:hypothetical protein
MREKLIKRIARDTFATAFTGPLLKERAPLGDVHR